MVKDDMEDELPGLPSMRRMTNTIKPESTATDNAQVANSPQSCSSRTESTAQDHSQSDADDESEHYIEAKLEPQSNDHAAETLNLSHIPGTFPPETAGDSLDERLLAPVEKHGEHTESTNVTVDTEDSNQPQELERSVDETEQQLAVEGIDRTKFSTKDKTSTTTEQNEVRLREKEDENARLFREALKSTLAMLAGLVVWYWAVTVRE